MCLAIAWPCVDPASNVRRMRRSSVPCSSSTRGGTSFVPGIGQIQCPGRQLKNARNSLGVLISCATFDLNWAGLCTNSQHTIQTEIKLGSTTTTSGPLAIAPDRTHSTQIAKATGAGLERTGRTPALLLTCRANYLRREGISVSP
jgi:hypothetical protein